MSQLVGQNLGPYSLLEVIGGGGMATVYKAYQPSADRFVAVKVIRADLSREVELRQRFEREARTIARLEHPFHRPLEYTDDERIFQCSWDRGAYRHLCELPLCRAGAGGRPRAGSPPEDLHR